jgi:hypothetical protein
MRIAAVAFGLSAIALAAHGARALETDQYYAWKRPLTDAAEAINAKINADIEEALARVNSRHGSAPCPCRIPQDAIRNRFYHLIIAQPEVWADNTAALDRIPSGAADETNFRRSNLYHETSPFDPIRWMPPSPTIEVAGVRVGADKLGHFFADGAWIEESYRRALAKGATEHEALEKAVRFSLDTERTIWGSMTSGVMSLADLDANYQGLLFYRGLCGGPDPALEETDSGWKLKRRFDIRDYVDPKWDESWEANIYTAWRWAKVKPVMRRYCELLRDPEIQRQRAAYAARDRESPTEEIVRKLVASGKLADPGQFTIEAVCGSPPPRASRGSDR